jgi:hypothetical protein
MASPNLTEIVTTTLRNRTGKLADNVTRNNAILSRLKAKGKVKTASGGRTLVQELEYAENGTFMWYSGYEPLNISPSDVITAAEFDWKQAAVAVSISGLEELQNASDERVIDLLESRIGNAEKTMTNQISNGLYATGTGTGGKEIGGLRLLVADDPTSGTVGGISRVTYTFWRNYVNAAGALTSANVQAAMNTTYLNIARGRDHPDLIMADNAYYKLYLESLQTIQRVTNTDLASAGFDNLKYMGADVVYDGGYQAGSASNGCPANHMYFLNTDYIFYRPHTARNMVPIGGERVPANQDAIIKLIGWAGNMTLSNAFLQGVLKV